MKFTLTLLALLLLSTVTGCGGSKVRRPVWTFSARQQCFSRQIIVVDGVLYCLAGPGDDPYAGGVAESMYALDASDGTPLWDLPLASEKSIPRRVHLYAQPIEPQIVAAEGLLCYLRRDGQLCAFDYRTGELRWKVSGVYLLLKIRDGVHVLDEHSRYAVLDPANGAIRISTAFERVIGDAYISLPVVADGKAYFIIRAVGEDRLSAVEVESGRLLWSREKKFVHSVVAQSTNEALLVKTGEFVTETNPETGLPHQVYTHHVLGLDTKTGQELWHVDAPFWPQIDGDIVYYYGSSDTSYRTIGVDTKTGEKVSDIPADIFAFQGQPVVSEEVEYQFGYRAHYNALQKAILEGRHTPIQLGSMDTWIVAKDVRNGEVIWTTTPLWGAANKPFVSNGFVYQQVCRAGQAPQLLAYRAAHVSR